VNSIVDSDMLYGCEVIINLYSFLHVPGRRSRILEVVIVRRLVTWVLGIWSGEGVGKGWERGGQFTSNLGPRWTDPIAARRVSK
jgi:hypothetical protein